MKFVALDRPKSAIFMLWVVGLMRMLWGFRSRCRMAWRWRCKVPVRIWRIIVYSRLYGGYLGEGLGKAEVFLLRGLFVVFDEVGEVAIDIVKD